MKWFSGLLMMAVVVGILLLTSNAARDRLSDIPANLPTSIPPSLPVALQIDEYLARGWADLQLTPAEPADDLTVLRRLSLALHGSIPSLEEIRQFESEAGADRLERWTTMMLADRRFADYFAQRLARVFVGADQGQFVLFRRDRFTAGISEHLHKGLPYDDLVRSMIASNGVWTHNAEVNFLTSAFANGEFDANELAGRTVRAFLGQRIDCAQCHDHPFAAWKQQQFAGLAAFYDRLAVNLRGVHDKGETPAAMMMTAATDTPPAVPFSPQWLGTADDQREQLGHWVTHADNRRFDRAIANRVWGLMFGRPYYDPVDDLPDPPANDTLDPASSTYALDLLAADFRDHNRDLRRLVQVIATTRAFRLASSHTESDPGTVRRLEQHWAVFPLVRLRPEQVIGAMFQSSFAQTIDQNSHWFTRFLRFVREREFVNEFGDLGDEELGDRAGTIPQALLRMNGNLTEDLTEPNPFLAVGRIASTASSPEKVVEACFLACLTRRPTQEELSVLIPLVAQNQRRPGNAVQDIYWALFNSAEFSWNH